MTSQQGCSQPEGFIMKAKQVLAAIAVGDIDQAIAWYGKLFGRPCDERPMKEAAEWMLSPGGGIQLVLSNENTGRSMVTLGVSDIESLVSELESRGIETAATAPGEGRFRIAQVRDPEGNLLTFAQDQKR
jgi:predicted enzyme related to lactoylglutathione lyase